MTHEEISKKPAYITTNIQMELYDKVNEYLVENDLSRSDFAKQLGVSKGYVTQLLDGEFDHRLSKFVELSTKIGYTPNVIFEPIGKGRTEVVISQLIHKLSNSIGHSAMLRRVKASPKESENVNMLIPRNLTPNKHISAV